jgi:hypothetical protein
MRFQLAKNASFTAWRNSLVRAIYLASIGVATIGWLWLIAWCALWLI